MRSEEEGPSPLAASCSGLCTPANGLSCRARSFSLAPCPARVQRPEHGAAEASPCLPRCSPPPGRPLARGRFPAPPQGLSPPLAPRGQHGGAEGRWKCRPSSKRARGPGSPLWKPVASQHTRSEAGPQIHVLAPSPAVPGSEWLTGRRLWGTLSGALPESGTARSSREGVMLEGPPRWWVVGQRVGPPLPNPACCLREELNSTGPFGRSGFGVVPGTLAPAAGNQALVPKAAPGPWWPSGAKPKGNSGESDGTAQ